MSLSTTTDIRTIRQPIEQVDKTIIDKLLIDLAAVPEGHYWTLDDGDPLHIPPTDMMVVLASTVRDPDNTDTGDPCVFADIYDLNGRRIPLSERPEGWIDQQAEIRKPGREWGTENAVHRLGDDYIVIGRGQWYVTGETTIDGERAFEVGTAAEFLARDREQSRQESRAFLDQNPIIEASQPWWADNIDVENRKELGEVLVNYSYSINVDDLFLGQEATLKGGKLTLGEVELQNGYHTVPIDEFTVLAKQLRGLGYVLNRLAEEAKG